MARLLITGWRKGLNTVGLIVVLKDKYGLRLGEALTAVNDLVGGRAEISIDLDSSAKVSDVVNDMDQFDISYKIVD